MVAVAIPDLKGALMTYLLESTALAALVGTGDNARISGRITWAMPANGIVLRYPGGPGETDVPGIWDARVDALCYGAGKDEGTQQRLANQTARTLLRYLVAPALPQANGWTRSGARVCRVQAAAFPIELVDPDDGWAYTVCQLLIRFGEAAA